MFLHTRRVFIVRSSESDNGATIKKILRINSLSSIFRGRLYSFSRVDSLRKRIANIYAVYTSRIRERKFLRAQHKPQSRVKTSRKRHSKRIYIASTFDFTSVACACFAGCIVAAAKLLSHLFIIHLSCPFFIWWNKSIRRQQESERERLWLVNC